MIDYMDYCTKSENKKVINNKTCPVQYSDFQAP